MHMTHLNAVILDQLGTILNNCVWDIIQRLTLPKPQVNVCWREFVNMEPNVLRPTPSDQFIVLIFIRSHVQNIRWLNQFTLIIKYHIWRLVVATKIEIRVTKKLIAFVSMKWWKSNFQNETVNQLTYSGVTVKLNYFNTQTNSWPSAPKATQKDPTWLTSLPLLVCLFPRLDYY